MTYIETRLLGKAQLTIDVIHKIKKSDSFPPIKTALLGKTQLTILIAHRSKSCCRLKLKTKHSFSSFLYFIKYSSFRRDWGKGKDTTTLHGLGITQLFCLHHTMLLPSAVTCIPVFDSHVSGKIFLCFATHNKINW